MIHPRITARPVYDGKRSLRQKWGVFVNGKCVLICTRYPSWITKVAV